MPALSMRLIVDRAKKPVLWSQPQPPPPQAGVPPGHNLVAGEIKHSAYLGSETVYEVAVGQDTIIKVLRSNTLRYEERGFNNGDAVWLTWNARSLVVVLS